MEAWDDRHFPVDKDLSSADGSRAPYDALYGEHIDPVGRTASRSRESYTRRFALVRLLFVRKSRLQRMAVETHGLADVDTGVLPSNSFYHSFQMCRGSSSPSLFDFAFFCVVFHECHRLLCRLRSRLRLSLSTYSLDLAFVL